MVTILTIVVLVAIVTFFYIRQEKFGASPSGERLARMQQSPNFKDGKFQNLEVTPDLTEGNTMLSVSYDFLFKKKPRQRPVGAIPSMKTDLSTIPADSNVLVWFGHSSYYMQLDGKRFLVDPVFSGNASPVPGTVKAFKGTDRYAVADLPDIDYLIISHDHYDHVDYQTLIHLKPKTKKVICGLGVGAHFERWGYAQDAILEKDWNELVELDSGFVIHTTPARHFSGRGFSKNNTLWMSYVLQSPSLKIYIGGDSGYGSFMADIGNKFGPIDLVILDDGQYDDKWQYIHMRPHEVVQAAIDLNAKRLFPVHSSKFVMANHPWDEPLIRVSALNKAIPLVTPMIGEVVRLNDMSQQFTPWWVGVE